MKLSPLCPPRTWLAGKWSLLAALAVFCLGAAGARAEPPLLRVPRIARPPAIDGEIGEEEYREFAAITGMVHYKPQRVIPGVQQVVWYLGYDQGNLYLAMDSPCPEGTWPVARVRPEDALEQSIDYPLLHDDHVEIQFGTYGRDKASLGGYGFYKILANARGALSDKHWHNGTPGSEELWEYGGDIACRVADNAWRMELRVPLRAIGIARPEGPDGFRMPVQLVRADSSGGPYFAGWVGGTWMAWDDFGEIVLDPAAPAFRFRTMGEVARGDLNLGFEIENPSGPAVEIALQVQAADGGGNALLDEKRDLRLAPGARGTLGVTGSLAWTPEGNQVRILSRFKRPGTGREEILYRVDLPVIHLTDDYFETHVRPWLASKPRTGDFTWTCAYWPSYGVVRGRVDLDRFGLEEKTQAAAAWSLTLRRQGTETPLATVRADLVNRQGELLLDCGPLEPGRYDLQLLLLDGEGGTVDRRTASFVRESYPWEGNPIGKQDVLVPPYTPIAREGMSLRPWGREYRIGGGGLPEGIVAVGGRRGAEPILRAPARLEAERDGQTFVFDGGARIEEAGDTRAVVRAAGELAGAPVRLEGVLEYDGWYQVRIWLDADPDAPTLERLSLVLPLWERADTMYVQRAGDSVADNRMGAIPAGEGVVWTSAQLPRFGRDWGSFVPVVYAGNGDKGLWWLAEENRDWTLSADRPAVEFVRAAGGSDVRIHLLAAPARADRVRRFEFALLASPVKPFPEDYRRRVWYGDTEYFGHSTEGYRTYGQSVDGFELYEDGDYEALAAFLRESPHEYAALVRDGKPMVLYGSTWMCGLGLDAFDTYGGEWLGNSDWSPRPDTSYKGRQNLQRTRTFETPRNLTPVGVNWTESFSDCFVWWYRRLFERVPVNGTWWDNASIGLIRDYDPERKEFYSRFNVFTRRRLTRRLTTMNHELGREPLWLMNLHLDFSFSQYAWHVENDFFPRSPEGTVMDELSFDAFRALTRSKHGILPQLDSKMVFVGLTRQQHLHQARTAFGLCLLHDIGARSLHNPQAPVYRDLLAKVTDTVAFFGAAEFAPYWDNADLVTLVEAGPDGKPRPAARDDLRVSLYRDGRRALLAVLNVSGEAASYPRLVLPAALLGRRVERVWDIEKSGDRSWRQTDGHWFSFDERQLRLERHGLMLLAVE